MDLEFQVLKDPCTKQNMSVTRENLVGDEECTTLFMASAKGHFELTKWYVEHGDADVNQKTEGGDTALHLATLNGYCEIARWLVEHGGSDINKRNGFGFTALLFAAEEGHYELAKWFVNHGGATIVPDPHYLETTPLFISISHGHLKLAKFFVQFATIQHVAMSLCRSIRLGRCEFAKWLVEHGGEEVLWSSKSNSPLHCAIEVGQDDLAKWLVKNGADVNSSEYGDTPLDKAILENNEPLVHWFLTNTLAQHSLSLPDDMVCTMMERTQRPQMAIHVADIMNVPLVVADLISQYK